VQTVSDDLHFHRTRRAMASGQAAFDAAEPPDSEDELAAALDAALDELRTLQMQLALGTKGRNEAADAAREIGGWLKEVEA
jgi:hypothetical protein